jgi:hypothetical protein
MLLRNLRNVRELPTEAFESKTMWIEKEKRSEYDPTKVIEESTMNGVSIVKVELAPARTLDSWSAVLFAPEFSIDSDTAAKDVERMWQRGLTAYRTYANVHAWWDRKYRPNVARRAAARALIVELRKRGASPAELDAAIAEKNRLVGLYKKMEKPSPYDWSRAELDEFLGEQTKQVAAAFRKELITLRKEDDWIVRRHAEYQSMIRPPSHAHMTRFMKKANVN